MTLCIALVSPDNVFMGVDSAVSVSVDNKIYRVHDQGQKIWTIDNQLIFCSGKMKLSKLIMDTYMNQNNRTKEKLIEIARELEDKYKYEIIISSMGEHILSEILFAEYEGNEVNCFCIWPNDDYRIEKITKPDDTIVWVGGLKNNNEALCRFNNISIEEMSKNTSLSVDTVYQKTYDYLSDEAVGGDLLIYRVGLKEIDRYYFGKIQEKNIKKLIRLTDNYYRTCDTGFLVSIEENLG